MMLASRARRIPIIDIDDETRRSMVVSVITQYRILKFVAVNVKETEQLQKPLKDLGRKVGSYDNLQTATMDTPVIEVIHMLVKKNISSVPILDKDGRWLEALDEQRLTTISRNGNQRLRGGGCHRAHQRRRVRRAGHLSRRGAAQTTRCEFSQSPLRDRRTDIPNRILQGYTRVRCMTG